MITYSAYIIISLLFISFKNAVSELNVAGIERIRSRAKDDIKAAFDYFAAHDVTAENLILELKEDFSEERLLLVDGNNISSERVGTWSPTDNVLRNIGGDYWKQGFRGN